MQSLNPFWLKLYLRVVGAAALLAFGAAVMPAKWIVEVSEELGFEPFPDSPLTFYLARNLSLLYGYVGAALLLVASDLARYRPLVWWTAMGTISFSGLQLVADLMAGLPIWWVVGEPGWTLAGGLFMAWLDRQTPGSDDVKD